MQYLVTDHEETRQQVLAAMSEAEGLGEVRTVASPEKLRELLEPEVPSVKSSPAPTPSFPLFC